MYKRQLPLSLCILNSRARVGMEAPPVTVEVQLAGGLPCMNIVGLPEMAVRESKDRVRGALHNGHFQFPAGRITVNLAPADLKKEGPSFDLPMALGMIAVRELSLEQRNFGEFCVVGELALNGAIRPVKGILSIALEARRRGRARVGLCGSLRAWPSTPCRRAPRCRWAGRSPRPPPP